MKRALVILAAWQLVHELRLLMVTASYPWIRRSRSAQVAAVLAALSDA